jgi:hypothetical protein
MSLSGLDFNKMTVPQPPGRSALVPRIRLVRPAGDMPSHDDDFEGLRNWTVILTLSAIFLVMATCPVLVLA